MAPKLHTMIPYICEFSIWNLLHVTIPAPGILKCFVYLEKIVNRCQETIFLISILVYVPQITSKVKCHICLCICHKETNDNTSCRSTDVFSRLCMEMSVHSRASNVLLLVPTELETSGRVWTFQRRDKCPPCDNRTQNDPPRSLVTVLAKLQRLQVIH